MARVGAMAVLVEAISVVVRVDAIERLLPDAWEGFKTLVPNAHCVVITKSPAQPT